MGERRQQGARLGNARSASSRRGAALSAERALTSRLGSVNTRGEDSSGRSKKILSGLAKSKNKWSGSQKAALREALEEMLAEAEDEEDTTAKSGGKGHLRAVELPKQRGSTIEVPVRGQYGARKEDGYDFPDVVALARGIVAKEAKATWLSVKGVPRTKKGAEKLAEFAATKNLPGITKIPYASMTRWIADDDKVMKKKGSRGVEGTPHCIAEWDVRGRRALTTPGSNPVLGQAETVLMHRLAEAAEANQPLPPENLPDILRSTAVQIGAVNQFGELYMREYTAQTPILESVPHPHLTWRQEEENHGVSKKLIAAKAPKPWHPRHRRIMTH